MDRIKEITEDFKKTGINTDSIFFVSKEALERIQRKDKTTKEKVGGWSSYKTFDNKHLLLLWELKGDQEIKCDD